MDAPGVWGAVPQKEDLQVSSLVSTGGTSQACRDPSDFIIFTSLLLFAGFLFPPQLPSFSAGGRAQRGPRGTARRCLQGSPSH